MSETSTGMKNCAKDDPCHIGLETLGWNNSVQPSKIFDDISDIELKN